MNEKIKVKNIADLTSSANNKESIRDVISCITINKDVVKDHFSIPISLDAFVAIIVLSGTASAQINYKTYSITGNNIILLSVSHLFKLSNCSDDFNCQSLLVSKKFMDDMDATEMIYRRIKYGSTLFYRPIVETNTNAIETVLKRISAIESAIINEDHLYYKELILNNLFAFYLDLSNIIERKDDFYTDGNFTRSEALIKSFIELLIKHYRTEHKVEFYSSHLNITPHYLTLIVKRITGQTVSDLIFEMLYSEARNLLTHSQLSIQEITSALNFSDQSAFRKFFNRKSGVSPKDYRRKLRTKES